MRWRRRALLGAGLVGFGARAQPLPGFGGTAFMRAVTAAETLAGGRFGVALLDSHTGLRFASRADERFPLASTFKFILAAAILDATESGRLGMGDAIPLAAADLVAHAPVTGPRLGGTMRVDELCEAIMVWSDNPAANLLLALVGGPSGLTAYARALGDATVRLDRFETALNEATPGDPRDTTTPAAMLATMQHLLLGDRLRPAAREQLTQWLLACRTGDNRIRAGLPGDWRCGNRTGGGGHGTANDIAILWPPGRAPILVAGYVTQSTARAEDRDAAFAALGRAIVAGIG
ncbi:MAG: class A beta-lactamase [Pseudomonadota bacterium]